MTELIKLLSPMAIPLIIILGSVVLEIIWWKWL